MNALIPKPETRLSVLMPVRNGEDTVAAAVESVLADLGPSDEVIVVDDHSTDGTLGVLQGLEGNIVLLPNPGRGIVDALNAALRTSKAAYIARCDADDTWLPGHISALLEALSTDPSSGAAFGAVQAVDDDGRVVETLLPPQTGAQLERALLRGNPLVHGAVLARRASLVELGGYRQVAGAEDYDLWMRIFRAASIVTTSKVVYRYRISRGATHGKKRRRQARSTIRILLEHASKTGRFSVEGLLRNSASSLWFGKRFWYTT